MHENSIVATRERLGVTQAELARRLGMKRPQLCRLERHHGVLSAGMARRIAAALDVEAAELFGPPGGSGGGWQPMRRAGAVERLALEQVAGAAQERLGAASQAGVVAATTLPLVQAYLLEPHSSEMLATALRESLGVGMSAFANLAWSLEFANVLIVVGRLEHGDSASWWDREHELLAIALSEAVTPERQLYRLAYELGAACLCRSRGGPVAESKREHRFLAEFAAAFLMPAVAVADMVAKTGIRPDGWTLRRLCAFKHHFGVSAEAFAIRLSELGLMSKVAVKAMRRQLRGYYRRHPNAMEPPPSLKRLEIGWRARVMGED